MACQAYTWEVPGHAKKQKKKNRRHAALKAELFKAVCYMLRIQAPAASRIVWVSVGFSAVGVVTVLLGCGSMQMWQTGRLSTSCVQAKQLPEDAPATARELEPAESPAEANQVIIVIAISTICRRSRVQAAVAVYIESHRIYLNIQRAPAEVFRR